MLITLPLLLLCCALVSAGNNEPEVGFGESEVVTEENEWNHIPELVFDEEYENYWRNVEEKRKVKKKRDLKKEEKILEWLVTMKDPAGDVIEEIAGDFVHDLVERTQSVAVYFYSKEGCKTCGQVLEELENIDDDSERHGIKFVKTQDLEVAGEFGIQDVPALLYFEGGTPSVFQGDLTNEEGVLQWLMRQKTEDTIEFVTRDVLDKMVKDTNYLAVFFSKPNCKACDQALHELENIDDDADVYGIQLVKVQDTALAKRYGIRTYPALVYFRNGNPLLFDGDIRNEDNVLEWLTADDNREMADEIEKVNARMLQKLLDESPFLAVFFYEENCDECDAVLSELENIDHEADQYGIDFVKVTDEQIALKYNIVNLPSLAYFRKKVPLVYDGDLLDEAKILEWLTSEDVIELKDEIEEVNRKMLDKLLDEKDFVAVYFFDDDCDQCDQVLAELERIDEAADSFDITFVKIKDIRYARKYGINTVPTLVYFRRRFPTVFRGDLMDEAEVLDWLQKSRYRHPELNIFMFAMAGVCFSFILYTIFFIYFFKPHHHKTA